MNRAWASVRTLLPTWDDYRTLRHSWKGDILAGITVGIVALPLALAFGVSSGVSAEAGLITAIVAGLVAAVFGGSNVQVSGPTGAMVVILAPIVAEHGIGAVAVVSLMAGALVLLMGLLRLGRTVSYIPWPVIEGFTVGIGIIIFLQQVPNAVGVGSSSDHSSNALVAAIQSLTEADWHVALLTIGAVVTVVLIMLLLQRIAPKVPGSFVAIVVVTSVSVFVGSPIATIGQLPASLPLPTLPAYTPGMIGDLSSAALAVAALAAIESLLSARVASSMADTGPLNPDRELVGQGLASVATSFFGGMPATGAIARTAVNVRSGAKTRFSAIVHALTLLGFVTLASQLVSHIPLAALAGVLMVTSAKMASPKVIGQVVKVSRSDAITFTVTAIITVSVDLIVAVGIGIAVATYFILRQLSKASGVEREVLPGAPEPGDERIALFTLEGSLFFAGAERIMEDISDEPGLIVVILRMSELQMLDATGAHTLAELVHTLEQRGVTVIIKGIRPEHVQLMGRLDVISSLRHPNHLTDDLDTAVEHARSHVRRAIAAGETA